MKSKINIVHISALFILFGALSRLIPHPANFTALTALGLFSGFAFKSFKYSAVILFASLLFSDLLIGFYSMMLVVYIALLIPIVIGKGIAKSNYKIPFALGGGLVAAISFFMITNFTVWLSGTLYPKTLEGLLMCYTAGIPFFKNQLCGDLLYSTILFGSFYFVQAKFKYHTASTPVTRTV